MNLKVNQKIVKLLEIFIFIIQDNVNDNKVKIKLPDIIYLDKYIDLDLNK